MTARLTRPRVAAAALVVAVAIQFVPVKRSNPPIRFEVEAPPEVVTILRRACYDCHSNQTRWPWYSRVAPVSWLVAWDVRRGREDLNFSEWPAFDFEGQDHARSDIVKQIRRGKMPPPLYRLMHSESWLRADDRRRLLDWARTP